MAITSFIPKVWSARLQESLHKALVFGSLCNRNYEGDIAHWATPSTSTTWPTSP